MRGEVWLVDLNPVIGSEANKIRPALIVGNAAAVEFAFGTRSGVVTVVPLTSNTERIYDFQARLPAEECGLAVDSKAQCEQVRSISVLRFKEPIGRVPERLMTAVDDALRLHLAL